MKTTLLLFLTLFFVSARCLFAQSTNPAPYCDASFDDAQGFQVDDHINTVSFGTLNNTTNSQYAAPHYVFYNNLTTANFIRGNTYTLSVNFTTAGGCGYGIWIDFNQNNQFEASEKISGTTGNTFMAVGSNPTITESVQIPATATLGNTRMRIRIVEDDMYNINTTSQLPCNASTSPTDIMDWGETEDYTINISSNVGIRDINNKEQLILYPDVSGALFTLETTDLVSDVRIYSISGSLVYASNKTLAAGIHQLPLTVPTGIYLIMAESSSGRFTQKFTVR